MYRFIKNICVILLMFFALTICHSAGMKKYIFILGLTAVFLILGRKKKWSPEVLLCVSLPTIAYLIMGGMISIAGGSIYTSTFKMVLFLIIPLLFAFSMYIFTDKDIFDMVDAQMIGTCLTYFWISGRFLMRHGRAESTLSFVFGLFFLYYLYKKKWGFVLLTIIFLYLTNKRITLLAVLVVVMVMFFLKLFRNDRRLVYTIWAVVEGGIGGYIWLICSGAFTFVCRGFGIDTSGRVKIYAQIVNWLENPVQLFGKGLGTVEILLEQWKIKSFANLHNDLLKFYIELGIIGLAVYLVSYGVTYYLAGKKLGNEKMCMLLAMNIYSMVLFATDNVSIYIIYLIPFYSILFAILSPNQQSVVKKKDMK